MRLTPDGEAVILYTMTNGTGASLQLSNIGAGSAVNVPDRNGNPADVALGYNSFESYFGDGPYTGKHRDALRTGSARGV
ncbi:MAG: hypothetical protein ACLR8Y_03745 [Alistipes indistinctus]